MADNESDEFGGGQNKGETSESGMRPPKHLVMGQENMAKVWKIWVRHIDWYAVAVSRFTLKGAEVEVGLFMSSLGPGGRKSRGNDLDEVRGKFYARHEYFSTKVDFVQDAIVGKPEI
jgi:hypothetical protein